MRVVITGASGFLGRAALVEFRKAGIDVVGVQRTTGGAGDVTVADYAHSPGGDVLIHLAENGDRSKVAKLGDRFVTEVQQRLKALLDGRYQHVVYASSSLVYASSDQPLRVGDPTNSNEFYSAGKLACEAMTLDAGGIALRFSNLYGLGQTGETVINTIVSQLSRDGPVVIRDEATVRDFLSVNDAVAALAMAAARHAPGILNIGSGIGTSIGDVARILLELNGTTNREVISTHRSTIPTTIVLNIVETTKKTNWAPAVTLRQGLAQLISRN